MTNRLITRDDDLRLSSFAQETAPATAVDGVSWKDLLDKSSLTAPTKIIGYLVTVAGVWAGNAKIRIVDGAGNKLWPFEAEHIQGTDFTSGVLRVLDPVVEVPLGRGYKLQFRSSDAGDGAGETLQLNQLDVAEIG